MFSKKAVIINTDLTDQTEPHGNADENVKKEIFDILVAAGYFRARIHGLSAFDKIIGGMTYCIEFCDYDINVDLLFHESLSIGQKIALTEKIVSVLAKMKCPHHIEPHQIQGLDFINIYPVIQWIVQKSVENRSERAGNLKSIGIFQFHNHCQLNSDKETLSKIKIAQRSIRSIQEKYGCKRQYKRKDIGNEDEKIRVKITLLEYGNKGLPKTAAGGNTCEHFDESGSGLALSAAEDDLAEKEIEVGQLLKNLFVAKEDDMLSSVNLSSQEKEVLQQHYAEIKTEMQIDSKQLGPQNTLKSTQNVKFGLDKKQSRIRQEKQSLLDLLNTQENKIKEKKLAYHITMQEIKEFEKRKSNADKRVLEQIQSLVVQNEELKQEENKFKEDCRKELESLQSRVKQSDEDISTENVTQSHELLLKEKSHLNATRLQLGRLNRQILSIQRHLDNVPDRTELAQYQRRFLELYNQVSAKHSSTKQFYALYNTLDDTKLYLEKELSLLNSIFENYANGMNDSSSSEEFINQFQAIVEGVKQSKNKVSKKCREEKTKKEVLNAQYLNLLELQRKYALAVKQLIKEYQRNEALVMHLKSIE